MLNEVLLYTGAILIFLWGAAHMFPTRAIVNGFGAISPENRRIITMTWIGEGLTMMFVGMLVTLVTMLSDSLFVVTIIVYRMSALLLLGMALLSLFTGAKTSILPMKLCPFFKSASAFLFLAGTI